MTNIDRHNFKLGKHEIEKISQNAEPEQTYHLKINYDTGVIRETHKEELEEINSRADIFTKTARDLIAKTIAELEEKHPKAEILDIEIYKKEPIWKLKKN